MRITNKVANSNISQRENMKCVELKISFECVKNKVKNVEN